MAASLINNKHLLWRAGFGPGIEQIDDLKNKNIKTILNKVFNEEIFFPIVYETPDIEPIEYTDPKATAEQKREIQRVNQKQNNELNLNFLKKMSNSKEQLREKMAFFWHGHFATRINNPKFNQQLLNIIREKSLGNFKYLLFEVSRSPAMLSFLNNQQNKKDHPNENFAREVMELFTMGRGNYTEKDIREAARAFTGWGYDKEGNFNERKKLHDTGTKTFLGKTGNFTGDDILNIILEQKSTAEFITKKIYTFFVNEKPDSNRIENLSQSFYQSGYDIKKLMSEIFSSSWFYDKKNIGNRIKSPTELFVGMMRILPMNIQNPENITVYQNFWGRCCFIHPMLPVGRMENPGSTALL